MTKGEYMGYMSWRQPAQELWAVVDEHGYIQKTRGGSSTNPKLMIYESESGANRVLNNPWIKQVIPDRSAVRVVCIYKVGGEK